jgi:hypothetical protein
MNKKTLALIPLLLILLVLAYGLSILKNRNNERNNQQTQQADQPSSATLPSAQTYTNNEFGFSLDLPAHYTVKPMRDEAGNQWVSFQRETNQEEWIEMADSTAPVFDLRAMTLAQFAELEEQCKTNREEIGPGCFPFDNVEGHKVLGRNNKYALIYTRIDKITDYPNDFTPEMFAEADEVIKSLKIFDVK